MFKRLICLFFSVTIVLQTSSVCAGSRGGGHDGRGGSDGRSGYDARSGTIAPKDNQLAYLTLSA